MTTYIVIISIGFNINFNNEEIMLDKIIAARSPEEFITKLVDKTKCNCLFDITKMCIHCFAKAVHKDKIMSGAKRLEFYHIMRRMERQVIQMRRIITPKEIKVYLRTLADKKLMKEYEKRKVEMLRVAA